MSSNLILRVMGSEDIGSNFTTMCLGESFVFATGQDLMLHLWNFNRKTHRFEKIFSIGPLQTPATACLFSSDQSQICYGNQGGTVQLFDLNKAKSLRIWHAHSTAVNCIAFSPIEKIPKTVLSCGDDGKISVLLTSQKTCQSIKAHEGPANCVAFSPDGKLAASSGEDGKINIFDLSNLNKIATISQHAGSALSLSFSPTLPLLISGGADRKTFFYNTQTYKPVESNVTSHSSKIVHTKFFPNSELAVSISDDSISIISIADQINQIEYSPLRCGHIFDVVLIENNVLILSYDRPNVMMTRVKISPTLFSSPPKHAITTGSNLTSVGVYKLFKKDRSSYISTLSERKNRISRLGDEVAQKGLTNVLEECKTKLPQSLEKGNDLVNLLNQRYDFVKLEHGSSLIEISKCILSSPNYNKDLAIEMINKLLTSFGKIVYDILKVANEKANAVNPAFDERKKKCENFVASFKKCEVELVKCSKSSGSLGKKAKNIIELWSSLLKF